MFLSFFYFFTLKYTCGLRCVEYNQEKLSGKGKGSRGRRQHAWEGNDWDTNWVTEADDSKQVELKSCEVVPKTTCPDICRHYLFGLVHIQCIIIFSSKI